MLLHSKIILQNMFQGHRSLRAAHPSILVIIYAKYGKNQSRAVWAVSHGWMTLKKRSRSKVVVRDTFFHASDHLSQIPKASIWSCTCSRADMAIVSIVFSFIAKLYLNDTGKSQRSSCASSPHMSVIICAQYRKNPCRTVVERIWQDVPYFSIFFSNS